MTGTVFDAGKLQNFLAPHMVTMNRNQPSVPQKSNNNPDISTQLQNLAKLRDDGHLTEAEYTAAKSQVLGTGVTGNALPVATIGLVPVAVPQAVPVTATSVTSVNATSPSYTVTAPVQITPSK